MVVPYQNVRDRFLAEADTLSEVEWLVAVGRFVQDRWLAEEQQREGKELDEQATWQLWDECTEKQLRNLRTEAGTALRAHVTSHWGQALRDMARKNLKPARAFIAIMIYVGQTLVAGFIGGVGLIALGLVIVKGAPWLAVAIKSALEVTPPH